MLELSAPIQRRARLSPDQRRNRKIGSPQCFDIPRDQDSFRPPDPGILPGERDTLIVASETNVCSPAVADLDRLALAQRNRSSRANPRTRLSGLQIRYAVQASPAAKPEVSVKRSPSTLLAEVVTQVAFEGADRRFRLWSGHWNIVVSRIGCVEPRPP